MRRQSSQQSYIHAEDPAVTHQDANIPRGRSRESVRRDDDFSSPTTDQPEHRGGSRGGLRVLKHPPKLPKVN